MVPQIIFLCLFSYGILNAMAHFGEAKKPDRYDIHDLLIGPGLLLMLLWWGGFFEPLLKAL